MPDWRSKPPPGLENEPSDLTDAECARSSFDERLAGKLAPTEMLMYHSPSPTLSPYHRRTSSKP